MIIQLTNNNDEQKKEFKIVYSRNKIYICIHLKRKLAEGVKVIDILQLQHMNYIYSIVM